MLGVLIFAGGSLGGVSQAHAIVLLGLTAGLGAALVWTAGGPRSLVRVQLQNWRLDRIALVVLGFVVIHEILLTCAAMAPPTGADALRYHLNAPQYYIHSGGIRFFPHAQWNYPMGIEMLFLWGMLLGSDVTAGMISALVQVGIALGIYGASRSHLGLSRSFSLLAVLLFLQQPMVHLVALDTKNDLGFTLVVLGSVLAASECWRGDRCLPWGFLSGVLAGSAAGMRYTGLVWLPAAGLVFVGALLLRRRSGELLSLRKGAGVTLAFLVGVLLLGGPWYLRNYMASGDPIWPMGYWAFQGRFMTPEFYEGWADERASPFGAGLLVMLLGLWNFTMRLSEMVREAWLAHPNVMFLAMLPGLPWAWRRSGSAARVFLLMCAVAAGLYYVGCFYTYPYPRLLLPTTPFLALLTDAVVHAAVSRDRITRVVVAGAVCIASIWYLGVVGIYSGQFMPVAFGFEERESFLDRKVTMVRTLREVNRILDPEDVVLVAWQNNYHLRQPKLDMSTNMQSFWLRNEDFRTAHRLHRRLCESGATHVLVDSRYLVNFRRELNLVGIDVDLERDILGLLTQSGLLVEEHQGQDWYVESRFFETRHPITTWLYSIQGCGEGALGT